MIVGVQVALQDFHDPSLDVIGALEPAINDAVAAGGNPKKISAANLWGR